MDIGRKIKAQARQAMKDGYYIGGRAPYGYRKDPDNCHKLLIDENTAPVVKQIFEWAHEHVGLNRIVRNLNEMGIPAPSHYKKSTGEITSPGLIGSGKWQTRTVMRILESEVYTGDLVQGKTKIVDHQQVKAGEDNLIVVRHTHEPIISHELFTAVQEYREQVCEESRAKPKNPYTPTIKRVQDLMQERDMNLCVLAKKCGISYSTIQTTARRGGQLIVETIERICLGLGITLKDFFDSSYL